MAEIPPSPQDDSATPLFGKAAVVGDRVRATGELDRTNAAELRAAMEELAGRVGSGFVVDLTGVTYLDSAVMSVFFQFLDRRPCLVVRANSTAERVLSRLGFAGLGLLDVEP
jgi:anti-anti-sigma factor